MNSFLYLVIFSVIFSTVSTSLYNLPELSNQRTKNDEVIYIRGKQFHKNGTSFVSALSDREAQIYTQCMDHNDTTCSETWSQRYWVNTNYYQTGGPVFFMLGAEGPADGSVDGFHWLWYAQKYGAVLVCLEHRFYGKSIPTTDTSFESLQLLTSQQALADAEKFIEDFKYYNNYDGAKVVVFGGSYGGNLAAWFRQKYPRSANVAVASSGPVEAKFDFTGYMKTVSEVIYWNNQACYFKIRDSFTCVENLVHGRKCTNSTYTDKSQINRALHQCWSTNFDDLSQRDTFFRWMAMQMWASNYPKTDDMTKCDKLLQQNTKDVLDNYGNFLTAMGQGQCTRGTESKSTISSYNDKVREFINSEEGIFSGAAGWYWQTCYEFGYYQTADPTYQVFGTDFTPLTYVQECQNQYGSIFTSEYIQNRIAQTNAYYKGKNNDGTCIIFVNGRYDPWHSLGINTASETSSKNYVVSIPTGEHCADMGYGQSQDIVTAQGLIQDQIGRYLADPNCA